MKTSFTQFQTMVEFMERNGDLSKPSGGPRGRHWCNRKWMELTAKLNSDGSGASRIEEKWRKVWSDLKNNTKKKAAKINRSMNKTGGGPALKMALTDLETRVMAIVGSQAATGMVQIQEVGFDQETNSTDDIINAEQIDQMQSQNIICIDESWNLPHSSHEPTTIKPSEELLANIGEASQESLSILELTRLSEGLVQTSEAAEGNEDNVGAQHQNQIPMKTPKWNPPKKKTKKTIIPKSESAAKAFLENEREKDKIFLEIEKDRIRQRDIELSLQRDWLQFMREALEILRIYFVDKQSQE